MPIQNVKYAPIPTLRTATPANSNNIDMLTMEHVCLSVVMVLYWTASSVMMAINKITMDAVLPALNSHTTYATISCQH